MPRSEVGPAAGQELDELTERIIGCAYKVSNTLGIGFVEKVYENAFAHEMRKDGLIVAQQHPIQVAYDGIIVGESSQTCWLRMPSWLSLKPPRH